MSFKDHEDARAQYDIVAPIDLGRKGVLAYIVRDRYSITPQRKDVIVEVQPTLSGQDRVNVLRSFERERQILTKLNRLIEQQPDLYLNRNSVVKLYNTPGSFTDPSERYLHLEYFQGGTLADYLRKEGALQEADARIIARDIAVAVKAHHTLGVVHRNITPHSVYLVITDNRVQAAKLGGYYLAQLDGQQETSSLDKATFQSEYLSPEQMQSSQTTATIATDIYQIGLILWEMLAGKARSSSDDTSISSERLHCSNEMTEIIHRSLAHHGTNGSSKHFPYVYIDDLISDLQGMITNPPRPYVPPVQPVPQIEPSVVSDRRPGLIIGGLFVAVVIGLMLVLVLWPSQPGPEAIRATAAALSITDTAVATTATAERGATAAAATSTAEQIAVAQTSVIGDAQTTVAQTAIAEVLVTTRAQTAVAQTAEAGAAQTATAFVVNASNETATSFAISETTVAITTAEVAQIATQTAIVAAQTSTAETIAISQTNISATSTASARPTATATRVRPTATVTPIFGLAISKKPPPSVDSAGCISIGISGVNTSGWTLRPDGLRTSASFSSTGDARLCGFAGGQQFTFTVFNRDGRQVQGGIGIPAREGEIFIGTWKRLN